MAKLAGHYHDTYGMAIANMLRLAGTRHAVFDSSIARHSAAAHMPACASRTSRTEDVDLLQGWASKQGIDIESCWAAGRFILQHLGRACGANSAIQGRAGLLATAQAAASGGAWIRCDHSVAVHQRLPDGCRNALCVGCYRTLDEIARWSRASDDAKRLILAAVAKRRAGQARPGDPTPTSA